ncbi:DUF1641 domain-containing protein [Tepidibacillus fermentans]|uniref:Uncharacterized protein YjgD (DUF1641 family) n=1 Tax=Tepidibacillus fermentans TaxID=1281767 RepID=A0A4R3KK22_9BACI|nr:DUF1641 domain-containing protein [Tepidibacillus fermentans]TCS83548.1 uncharacterized protein YjgD (DUF1641 family) [Tepidibacillus fermentans]
MSVANEQQLQLTAEEMAMVKELLQTLSVLKEKNVLKDLVELATFVSSATRALNTGAVIKLAAIAGTAMEYGDRVFADIGGMDTIDKLLDAVEETQQQIKDDTSKVGIGSLLKLLKDPGVQKALKFVLTLSKNLSK